MVPPVSPLWQRLSWRHRITLGVVIWALAETLALALIVQVVGVSGALILGLATSVIGAILVKRLGRSAMAGLRRGAGPGGLKLFQGPAALDGLLAGCGAVLLLIPGFLTDLVGLLLAVPAVRRALAGLAGGGRLSRPGSGRQETGRRGPSQIDLDADDWHVDQETKRSLPKV